LPLAEILLPVGISFFTFHGISYLVDVYRGDVPVSRFLPDILS
jgi:D-alanyl-lipoteichoic acid acyltransferase DltB (MBOAT superfamily)